MPRRGATLRGVLVAVALVGAVGCRGDESGDVGDDAPSTTSAAAGGETSAACAGAIDDIGTATERYVRGYETGREVAAGDATGDGAPTTTTPDPVETLDEAGYQEALTEAQDRMVGGGCDPAATRIELAQRLSTVDAEGPVADAVLRQVTAGITGQVPGEPADTTVAPGEDLRDAAARSPDGSTLRLAAGEHRLDDPLVLLSGVEIVGEGRDRTSIVSTATDSAVLALTDSRVTLRGLTIVHEGEAPASVVVGGPAASVAVADVRVAGGRLDAAGQGGAGILMFGPEASGRGTTLEVTDAELVLNQAAGIVLSGGHRASIVSVRFEGNGQCGICFLEAADGSVEDSTFAGNTVGVATTGTARPSLLRLTVTGGEVGLQAGDSSAPAVQGATFSGTSRAALIFSGTAGGSLDGVTCQDVPFGIVVGPDVQPAIGETDCEVVRSSG